MGNAEVGNILYLREGGLMEKKANDEFENWNKMRRLDKIRYPKKKREKETKTINPEEKNTSQSCRGWPERRFFVFCSSEHTAAVEPAVSYTQSENKKNLKILVKNCFLWMVVHLYLTR